VFVKLSFIPADLHLSTDSAGKFVVTLQGTEIFRSSSSPKAIKKFNEVKKELEEKFPTHACPRRKRRNCSSGQSLTLRFTTIV
jgi:hypothetical protein